jgi:chemotaxis protein methyltransferase CheR
VAFTFFFRDAETLELAIEQMLPVVQGHDNIDIWDAGCAHGPEPYTLAILLREMLPEHLFRKVRIHATDVDCCFADQVVAGIFPESELRRLPAGFREKYFHPSDTSDKFEIIEDIRAKISFARHDLLSLIPFTENLSLIVCKNVLLHFNEQQRVAVLRMFHDALRADGTLVMEHTQKIPALLNGMFRPLVGHAQVFGIVESSSKIVSRRDHPANACRHNLKKNVLCGRLENDQLEKGAMKTVHQLP